MDYLANFFVKFSSWFPIKTIKGTRRCGHVLGKTVIRIGSDSDNEIQLQHESVAAKHATVVFLPHTNRIHLTNNTRASSGFQTFRNDGIDQNIPINFQIIDPKFRQLSLQSHHPFRLEEGDLLRFGTSPNHIYKIEIVNDTVVDHNYGSSNSSSLSTNDGTSSFAPTSNHRLHLANSSNHTTNAATSSSTQTLPPHQQQQQQQVNIIAL